MKTETRPFDCSPIKRGLALAILAFCLLSCQEAEVAPEDGAAVASGVAETSEIGAAGDGVESAPFDLSGVIARVERSFRPDGAAYVASGDAHELRVRDGKTFFVAIHYEEAERLESELELETVTLIRGATSLEGDALKSGVGEDGELVIDRGAVTERLSNAAQGVEQTWTFAQAPRGEGDLLVEVSVEGQQFAGVTPTGVHFVDRATGVGVRYGHASWIDAAGARHELSAHWDGARIELRVPSTILESSSYPAILDPVVSSEFGIDAPARGPATRWQSVPDVAFNGTHYLVVWRDLRAGTSDIYAARVDASGAVVDHGGIAVGLTDTTSPAVETDGTQFLVVWSEQRNGDDQIRGARVGDDGTLVDPTSFVLVPAAGEEQRNPVVVFDGTNYFVVWRQEGASTNAIVATRVAPGATVLDPGGITVSSSTERFSNVDIAFNGTDHLITWTASDGSDYDVFAARVAAGGGVVDTTPLTIAANPYTDFVSSVASDGTDFLVVWSDDPASNSSYDLRAARVRADGTIVDAGGFLVSAAAGGQVSRAVSFDGTNYMIAWDDTRSADHDIYASRVGVDGSVLDPAGIVVCDVTGNQTSPAIHFDGSRHIVVWTDNRVGYTDIYGARIESTGVVVEPDGFLITTGPRSAQRPSVAFDGTNYLLAWEHGDARGTNIYAVRVDSAGNVLDPSGIPVSTEPTDEREPKVGFDGTNFLIVWSDERADDGDIYARLMTPAGTLMGTGPTIVSAAAGGQYVPDLDYDGTNYFVVWRDSRNGNADVFGARVDAGGAVLNPAGVAISTHAEFQGSPRVRFGGGQYLVVWQQQVGTDQNILAARVDTAMNVIDPNGIVVSGGPERELSPALACDQTQFLVVWIDERGVGRELFGARVAADGSLLDPSGFVISSGDISNPDVVFSGGEYLLAWQVFGAGRNDIRGARLDRTGALLDGTDFAIADTEIDEVTPVLATSAPGEHLVAYSSYRVGRGDGAQLKIRRLLSNTTGSAPTADAQTVVVDEDQSAAITLTGMDPDGFPVTFVVTSTVAHGSLVGAVPDLVYTPVAHYHGPDLFHFLTNDGSIDSAIATVTIDVRPVNDAPVIESVAPADAVEDVEYSYPATATDVDGDALTWGLTSSDDCGGVIASDGTYTFTPAGPIPPTDCRVGIEVCDDGTPIQCAEQLSVVAITAVNDAPTFVEPTPTDGESFEVAVEDSISLRLAGVDPDGDPLTYDVSPLPGVAQLDADSGAFDWSPDEGAVGQHSLTLSVSDGALSKSRTIVVEVVPSEPDADVGSTPDVGPTDPDPDVGVGGLDAGQVAPDAATSDEVGTDEGCNCSSAGGTPDPGALLMLVGLLAFRRRRRASE